MYKLLSCLLLCFTLARALPVEGDADSTRVKKAADGQLNQNGKLNDTGVAAGTVTSVDKSRVAYYPISGGYGYHNIGQMVPQLPHYPTGWLSQQYVNQVPTGMQYKTEELAENSNARTFGLHGGLRPSLYSQYQTAPQVYAIPVSYSHSSDYSTPYYGASHYGSYSPYSYYRNAGEDEKLRQFWNLGMSDKIMSPMQTPTYYTKYLIEKPTTFGGMNQMTMQTPMVQHLNMPVRSAEQPESNLFFNTQPEIQMRDVSGDDMKLNPTYGYSALSDFRGRNLFVDDKLQMQIGPDYLANRLRGMNPFDTTSQPQSLPLIRAAEELKPMENWPQGFAQNMDTKNSNSQQYPMAGSGDVVYMEPLGYPQTQPQVGRSVEQPMMFAPSSWNLRQQQREAEIQWHRNAMNQNAAKIEYLVNEGNKDRETTFGTSLVNGKASEANDVEQMLKKIIVDYMNTSEQKDQPKSEGNQLKKDDAKTAAGTLKKDENQPKSTETVGNPSIFSASSTSGRH